MAFESDFASHAKHNWHAPNLMCEKASEWKTWLQMVESHLIASWVHQVCASNSFSRAFVLEWAFSCYFLPHELCKVGWKRNWSSTAVVWTLDCSSFAQTSIADDSLWNPGATHCLVAIFITCSLARFRDSVFFCFASACNPRWWKADQIWLNWVGFGLKFSSFPFSLSLEKLHRERLAVVWRPGLMSVGCSGMRWGWVLVFWGQGLELVLTCVKRECDSGNMLSVYNVMESCQSLSVPLRVGGRRRRVHCLWRVVLYGERKVWRERKKRRLEREFLPVMSHFRGIRALCWTVITFLAAKINS